MRGRKYLILSLPLPATLCRQKKQTHTTTRNTLWHWRGVAVGCFHILLDTNAFNKSNCFANTYVCWRLCQPLLFLTPLLPQINLPTVPLMEVLFGGGAAQYTLICFRQKSITVASPDEGRELMPYPNRSFRHVHRWLLQMWEGNKNLCPFSFLLV